MFDRFNLWVTKALAGIRDESGQTFVEYSLILAVVVIALLLAYTQAGLGTAIKGAMDSVVKAFG
jgi:Flp pilus assembly pilin Flp